MLPQWHVKDPCHSAKSVGGRLHLNTLHPWPNRVRVSDYAAVQAQCGNLPRNKLTHNSSGNIRLQLSQPAEPLWTDLGLMSGISMCELLSTSKKKKKHRQEMDGQTFSPNPCKQGKSHHHRLWWVSNDIWGQVFVYPFKFCWVNLCLFVFVYAFLRIYSFVGFGTGSVEEHQRYLHMSTKEFKCYMCERVQKFRSLCVCALGLRAFRKWRLYMGMNGLYRDVKGLNCVSVCFLV